MMTDKGHAVRRHLIVAALQSNSGGFEKVTGMVDNMVGVLEGEQAKDDKQDVWCLAELDKAKDEAKATEVEVGDLGAAVEQARDSIASVDSEIEALKTGLEDLDESAGNAAAVELLGMAKNRLNKFYNPTLYKAPPAPEEEDFFAQRAAIRADQPGPAPETFGEYKKSESSSGVINMIGEMVTDVEKDMAEAKRDEEEAQKDYEETMNDAATKRADDSKLMVTKESEKAEKTTKLEELKEAKRTKSGALEVLEDKIDNLHKTCDFLIDHYKAIKEERTKEEEGLKSAKSVLAGAKLGFLQK